MTDVVKKSGVRNVAADVNVGAGFYEAIDGRVKSLIRDAVDRAKENDRRTVKARDV